MAQSEDTRALAMTKRDVSLLALLQSHILLSYGQIQRLIFSGRSHPTVLNRLRRLEGAGFIIRQRVHRIRHPLFAQEIGVVFQVTPKGILELQKYFPKMALPEKVPSLHGRQLDHDLLIVEVAERLKGEFGAYQYVNGASLESKKPGEPRPDGVFGNSNGRTAIAIEVELTVKSCERYREICSSYRMCSRFECVIFVVASVAIANRIMREIKGYEVESVAHFKDSLFEIRLLQDTLGKSRLEQSNDLGGVA